ncbi:hypothetical protein AB3R30_19230 [Leptolyngbyaceae cyanobacterium UHCC 1019]
MPRKIGAMKQKKRGAGQAPLKEVQEHNRRSREMEMEAVIQDIFEQHHQKHPEEVDLAWSIGVYDPFAGMKNIRARLLTDLEQDWLFTAKAVEWLVCDEKEDAIYFTAPPPDFALKQADWYLRPDLTTFLDEPIRLSDAVEQYPITLEIIQGAIGQRIHRMGWTMDQLDQFLQKLGLEESKAEFDQNIWEMILFELQMREER